MTSKLFVSIPFLLILFLIGASENACAANYFRECESRDSNTWGGTGVSTQVRIEGHSNASNGQTLHLGPDWSPDDTWGINDEATYNVTLTAFTNAAINVEYSDDVAGNAIRVYLDNVEKGQFITVDTGDWNTFKSTNQIKLGAVTAGQHTIKLKVTNGGSYGMNLDFFEIRESQNSTVNAVSFIQRLVDPNTGLVSSRESESYTTVYKNSLAAMVFIHEGQLNYARGIFNFFKNVYDNTPNFAGFTKEWDADTGAPAVTNYWEGDNAFLLIALNYYEKATGSIGDYSQMRQGLIDWLTERGNNCDEMIAEGAADMYAALAPFACEPDIDAALIKIKNRYYASCNYPNVMDHLHRGSLIFGDLQGFDYLDNFYLPNELWEYDDYTSVSVYKAFSGDTFSNIEISTQLLGAWRIWNQELADTNLTNLETELDKLWLNSENDINSCGLPYHVQNAQFDYAAALPMVDPTAFMLFYNWNFNPCYPGDKFVQLYEAEDFNSTTWGGVGVEGQIRLESKTTAFNGQVLHLGPDWSPDDSYGVNDKAEYVIDLLENYNTATIKIRYADDVAGNVVKVYLDGNEKGQFQTSYTGGWNTFAWTDPITLGSITAGQHTIELKVTTGGSYGLVLDVFQIARQNIVHFTMPYSQREQANYSGAACMKMILDRQGPNTPSQSALHNAAIAQNSAPNLNGTFIDPQGMYLILNANELNPDYNYSWMSSNTINDAFHTICYWIEYDVVGANPQNMPTAIPLGGDYENWVLVNGFNASANPWQSSTYTVYGFWLTDPSATGIGQNVYKTASELANDFITLETNDSWAGKFVSVCEPPQTQAQVTIAEVAKFKDKLSSNKDIIDAAVKGLQDNVLNSDIEMQKAFTDTSAGKPILVKAADGNYYIVPFMKNNGCAVTAIVDAKDGAFKQASYSKEADLSYLTRFNKKCKAFKHVKGGNAFLPQAEI